MAENEGSGGFDLIGMMKQLFVGDDSKLIELEDLIEIFKSRDKKIIIFSGAGISTAAGIPDFRSKDGLYALIKEDYKINNPTEIFDLGYFKENPAPFFDIARLFINKQYKPTLSHCFVKLLEEKGLLFLNFSQNIDGLDKAAGISEEKIIECHGHFRIGHCISCNNEMSFDMMKKQLDETNTIKCDCGGLVKPDIVFFGENLPGNVFGNIEEIQKADLAIVIGTSLTVSPFCFFVQSLSQDVPILLLNREMTEGIRKGNLCFMKGDCDESVRKICDKLNWTKQLDEIYKKFHE